MEGRYNSFPDLNRLMNNMSMREERNTAGFSPGNPIQTNQVVQGHPVNMGQSYPGGSLGSIGINGQTYNSGSCGSLPNQMLAAASQTSFSFGSPVQTNQPVQYRSENMGQSYSGGSVDRTNGQTYFSGSSGSNLNQMVTPTAQSSFPFRNPIQTNQPVQRHSGNLGQSYPNGSLGGTHGQTNFSGSSGSNLNQMITPTAQSSFRSGNPIPIYQHLQGHPGNIGQSYPGGGLGVTNGQTYLSGSSGSNLNQMVMPTAQSNFRFGQPIPNNQPVQGHPGNMGQSYPSGGLGVTNGQTYLSGSSASNLNQMVTPTSQSSLPCSNPFQMSQLAQGDPSNTRQSYTGGYTGPYNPLCTGGYQVNPSNRHGSLLSDASKEVLIQSSAQSSDKKNEDPDSNNETDSGDDMDDFDENDMSEAPLKTYAFKNEETKGYTLLFFNEEFANDKEKEHTLKSGNQPRRLKKLFKEIGFSVRIFRNWSGPDMQKKIKRYASRTQSCFVCFISSHGADGEVCDKDWKSIKLKTLIGLADTTKLKGIPKCFFVCACRVLKGKECKYDGEPSASNTLIGYAAMSGQESEQYRKGGSVYFDYIIKNLEESLQLPKYHLGQKSCYSRDIDHILKKVGRDMEEKLKYRPVYQNTLNHDLFLRKGND